MNHSCYPSTIGQSNNLWNFSNLQEIASHVCAKTEEYNETNERSCKCFQEELCSFPLKFFSCTLEKQHYNTPLFRHEYNNIKAATWLMHTYIHSPKLVQISNHSYAFKQSLYAILHFVNGLCYTEACLVYLSKQFLVILKYVLCNAFLHKSSCYRFLLRKLDYQYI